MGRTVTWLALDIFLLMLSPRLDMMELCLLSTGSDLAATLTSRLMSSPVSWRGARLSLWHPELEIFQNMGNISEY